MTTEIDLSKKPDGATHINPHSGLWIKCFGGNSGNYQYFNNGEWEMGFGCMSDSYLKIAQPAPWTGEGLPPVGIVCELFYGQDQYGTVTILAHAKRSGSPVAVYQDDDEFGAHAASLFRPIRTPEQIAAEAREKAIKDLFFTINWNESPDTWEFMSNERKSCFARAIDAGYRKFEIVDE